MRRNQFFCSIFLLALCAALLSGCAGTDGGSSAPPPDGALLTVDGYPVPAEEFQLFLSEERALTAAYFTATFGAEIDAGFWDRDFSGQTPNQYARQAALNDLLTAKMESILLKERGVADDISFEGLVSGMENTNAERAEQLAKGEVFYGLTEYDLATYYTYVRSQRWGELVRSQAEHSTPTQEALRALYDENTAYFTSYPTYVCRFAYRDGTSEELTISASTVAKEDEAGAALLALLGETAPGSVLPDMSYAGKAGDVTLLIMEPGARLPFDDADVQAQLAALYQEEELYALLRQRVADAVVVLDQARYEALTLE